MLCSECFALQKLLLLSHASTGTRRFPRNLSDIYRTLRYFFQIRDRTNIIFVSGGNIDIRRDQHDNSFRIPRRQT